MSTGRLTLPMTDTVAECDKAVSGGVVMRVGGEGLPLVQVPICNIPT